MQTQCAFVFMFACEHSAPTHTILTHSNHPFTLSPPLPLCIEHKQECACLRSCHPHCHHCHPHHPSPSSSSPSSPHHTVTARYCHPPSCHPHRLVVPPLSITLVSPSVCRSNGTTHAIRVLCCHSCMLFRLPIPCSYLWIYPHPSCTGFCRVPSPLFQVVY